MKFDVDDLRKRYSLMSDVEFAALKRDDLADAARHIYDMEAESRKSQPVSSPPTVVKITTRFDESGVRCAWPRHCARCDSAQVANYLQLITTFELKPLTFASGFLSALGSRSRHPYARNLAWKIPVCAQCRDCGDTGFVTARSIPQVISVAVATDMLHTPLLNQTPTRTEQTYALNNYFTFDNAVFAARFKRANTPELTCSKCNAGVPSPYRRCVSCGVLDPVSWISWEATSVCACYACTGCNQELPDDATACPHCGKPQSSRGIGDSVSS
jgi:hypothetical protein